MLSMNSSHNEYYMMMLLRSGRNELYKFLTFIIIFLNSFRTLFNPLAFATDRSKAVILFSLFFMFVSWSCVSYMVYIFTPFNLDAPLPFFTSSFDFVRLYGMAPYICCITCTLFYLHL